MPGDAPRALRRESAPKYAVSKGGHLKLSSRRYLSMIEHHANLIFYKAYADLRAEPHRTLLGGLWWLIGPMLDCAIYYLVFGVFLNYRKPHYVPFLLIGLVAWKFIETGILRAAGSINANAGLIQLTAFRKVIFPLVSITTTVMEFGFSLVVLLVVLVGFGFYPQVQIVAFPAVFLVQLLLVLGVALPVAAMTPLLPDLQRLTAYGLRAGFYVSSILYTLADLPRHWQQWLALNPVVPLMESYRAVLMHGQWPDWHALLGVAVFGGVMGLWGIRLLNRHDKHYAKRMV